MTDIKVEVHPLVVTNSAFARQGALLDKAEHLALSEGIVTEEELQRWHASLEQADSNGAFFSSVNQVMVVGRKP